MKDFESLEKIKPKYEVLLSDAMNEAYNMGYNKGRDDAWECVRKAEYMLFNQPLFEHCFGDVDFYTVIMKMSASEAMAKVKEYEERQETGRQETESDKSWLSVPVDKMTVDQLRAALKDTLARLDLLKGIC